MADSPLQGSAQESLECFTVATKRLIEEAQSARTDHRYIQDRIECRIRQLLQDSEEVVHADEEIRYLKSAYNSAAPVSRLPLEVLVDILLHYRSQYPIFEPRNSWLHITQICRLWRHVTLECAEFWTAIDCSGNLGMAEEMLGRAKDAPISVQFIAEPRTTESHLSFLLRCLARRLASVDLRCSKQSKAFELASIISHFPADRTSLKKVSIMSLLGPTDPGIPGMFLEGENPSLRTLEIAGNILWKSIPHAPLLTNLTLLNERSGTNFRPPAATFFQSLFNLQQLQRVHLAQFLPSDTLDLVSGSRSRLPHLQYLTLDDQPAFIVPFLNACTIAPDSYIFLYVRRNTTPPILPEDSYIPLFAAIPSIWAKAGCTESRKQLHKLELHEWGLSDHDASPRVRCFFQGEGNSALDVWFASPLLVEDAMHNILIPVVETFRLHHLRSLVLHHCRPTLPPTIWALLSFVGSLRRIEFCQSGIGGFVQTLQRSFTSTGPVNAFPFFGLTQLVFSGYGDDPTTGHDQHHWTAVLSVADVMAKRTTPSVPRQLLVTSSNMDAGVHEKLKAFNHPCLNIVLQDITLIDTSQAPPVG